MFRKVVAASFVAVWLALLGIEFSEDIGLFEYSEPDMDRAVEATLASLGEAIRGCDDTQVIASHTLSDEYGGSNIFAIERVWLPGLAPESEVLKNDFKIYKLHRVFLI